MRHYAMSALAGTSLFRTWEEGAWLWRRLVVELPGVTAMCVMPDHLHVLHERDVARELATVARSYARWRNHRRGERGPVWRATSRPSEVSGQKKRWRNEKYVHLNPCRAGLASDPLAWPLSTYRDAIGLALTPVRSRAPDVHAYHRRTCADDHVIAADLPAGWGTNRTLEEVACAVSSLARAPERLLLERSAERTLCVQAMRALTEASTAEIAACAGITERQVRRVSDTRDDRVRLIERVLGDLRFGRLGAGELHRLPEWQRYLRRHRQPMWSEAV